jgi:hypothetical protein
MLASSLMAAGTFLEFVEIHSLDPDAGEAEL